MTDGQKAVTGALVGLGAIAWAIGRYQRDDEDEPGMVDVPIEP